MQLTRSGEAGTADSGDIQVTVSPTQEKGITVDLTGKSVILKQFGRQIRELLLETAHNLGLENAKIEAKDNGALDFTIKARVTAAIQRAMKGIA